ncbi:hypothetical protein BOTBODRAFT_33903 [Botryobasidium botryosum FD-172 SS1]|uniref:Uncharacterized protein n=1 Tax=Botryobasidium botryosum (strain FD-172 SS1) TaxID=930990 RepID=A0A067ME76_BOTB1|nr:hypothetical protein BOTBODRAFT_33903 [Botryobasidium botryosum FD-172 SS1]
MALSTSMIEESKPLWLYTVHQGIEFEINVRCFLSSSFITRGEDIQHLKLLFNLYFSTERFCPPKSTHIPRQKFFGTLWHWCLVGISLSVLLSLFATLSALHAYGFTSLIQSIFGLALLEITR